MTLDAVINPAGAKLALTQQQQQKMLLYNLRCRTHTAAQKSIFAIKPVLNLRLETGNQTLPAHALPLFTDWLIDL